MKAGIRRLSSVTGVVLAAGVTNARAASDDAIAAFYKTHQVILQTGSAPGDGYDVYGRLIAQFLGDHIPGKPKIIDEYVPGGGSLPLANQFGNVTPHDGSVFGLFNSGMPTTPLLNPSVVKFDPRKFAFLGSPSRDVEVFISWAKSPVRSVKDLFDQEVIVGASAPGAAPFDFPLVMNELIGTHLKIISGYGGTAALALAMERGEVQANPAVAWVSAKIAYGTYLSQGKMKLLAQYGFQKSKALPDTPLLPTGSTDEARQIFQLLYARSDYGRPFALPPGVPADRVAALRRAFDETVADPRFLEAAKKVGADIDPVSGQDLQALTDKIYATPAAVVARLQSILSSTGAAARKP
jgi:tripartite-type tricarboxylate transporter receptor subunit TctC